MTRVYSKYARALSSAVLLLAMVVTAQGATVTAASNNSNDNANGTHFCSGLDTKYAAVQKRYSGLKGKVSTAWTAQDKKLQNLRSQRDAKITAIRKQSDEERRLNFAKLEDKATTEQQKQAVQTYETAITQAAETRRTAVDGAQASFRQEVKDAVAARRDTLTTQMTAYGTAMQIAYSTAQSSCDNGVEPASVRTTLLASLKVSHEAFVQQRQSDNDIKTQIATLAHARNITIKNANKAYVATAQAATKALKAAFGNHME